MVEEDFAADNFSLQDAVDETEQVVTPIRINISNIQQQVPFIIHIIHINIQ